MKEPRANWKKIYLIVILRICTPSSRLLRIAPESLNEMNMVSESYLYQMIQGTQKGSNPSLTTTVRFPWRQFEHLKRPISMVKVGLPRIQRSYTGA